jgi:hypothetical protein
VTTNKAWVRPQVSDVVVASDPENGKLSRPSGTVEMPRYTAAVIPPSSWTPAYSRPAAPGISFVEWTHPTLGTTSWPGVGGTTSIRLSTDADGLRVAQQR